MCVCVCVYVYLGEVCKKRKVDKKFDINGRPGEKGKQEKIEIIDP